MAPRAAPQRARPIWNGPQVSAHLEWAAGLGGMVRMAGPLLSPEGQMVGSVFLIEAADLAASMALNADDPYSKAGVFGQVAIHETRWAIGEGKSQ